MLCEEFERRWQQLLDLRHSPEDDEQLQAHAFTCDACRENLMAQERLLSGLRMLDLPGLRPDFPNQVVAQIVVPRPDGMTATKRLALSVLAACLLMVLLPAAWRAFGPPDKTTTATVAFVSSAPPSGLSSVSVGTVAAKASSPAPSHVVQSSAGNASSEEWMHPSLLDELRDNLSQVSIDRLESVDQIAEGFRPLASSLQTAINVLRRNLPMVKEQRAPKSSPDTSGLLERHWIA